MPKYTLPVIALAGFVAPAWSAVDSNSLPGASQEQVIVSATRSEQTSANIPANIVVIGAEEIERSGVQSLPDLLRSRAGIQVQDVIGSGGRGTTLIMRGFGSNAANNTLVMLDGQKLNNPSLASPDLSSITLADIERVEIIQGSAGVLFGDQATGGVINIITKQPQQQLSANLEVGRASLDGESYRGSVSEGFDNGLAYRLSGEHRLADNYRDNNNTDYANILLNTSYTAARFSVFAEAQQVQDDMRLPSSLTLAQTRQDRQQTTTPNDFTNIDTDRYRVGTQITLTPQWKLAAEYSYRNADSDGFTSGSNFTDNTTIKAFTPRLLGDFDTTYGKAITTIGFDGQRSSYEYSLPAFTYYSDIEQNTDDMYAQLVLPIYTDVTATVGARHSKLDQKNHISDATNDDSKTVNTYGLSWQFTQSSRVFARRDSSFRWATADENGLTQPGIDFLKPQTSDSNELGYEWRGSGLLASAVLYRLDTDDELMYDPAALNKSGGFGANINLPSSRRNGINTELSWAATDALELRASAGYVDAEIQSGNFNGNTVPFVAKYTGSFGVDWQVLSEINFYLDAQYTGSRYRVGDDPNLLGELGGYTLYNAALRWQHAHWYATLRVNNLTAKEYEGFTGISPYTGHYAYPAAERQTMGTVGYKF
jgi:iron complex outermembrane receptor protein